MTCWFGLLQVWSIRKSRKKCQVDIKCSHEMLLKVPFIWNGVHHLLSPFVGLDVVSAVLVFKESPLSIGQ